MPLPLEKVESIDLVVEVGGSETLSQSLRATRANGAISLVGNVTGSTAEVNLPLVFMFRKRLIGIATGSVSDFQAMMDHIADTEFRPALDDRVYSFDGLSDALQSITRGEHFGKIVVNVA